MEVKIISNTFMTSSGLIKEYGVIIDGVPKISFTSEDKLISFLRRLYGNI